MIFSLSPPGIGNSIDSTRVSYMERIPYLGNKNRPIDLRINLGLDLATNLDHLDQLLLCHVILPLTVAFTL